MSTKSEFRICRDSHGYGIKQKVAYIDNIPAGVYELKFIDDVGYRFIPTVVEAEAIKIASGSVLDGVLKSIDHFLLPATRKKYEAFGMLYKRGILLHGVPGCGKTTLVNQVIAMALKKKMMIVLNPNPQVLASMLRNVRSLVDDDTPILVVWEDIDGELCSDDTQLRNFSNLLDGQIQVNNIIYLATTNNLEAVPEKLKNRPSRFADVIQVPVPTLDERKDFLSYKAGLLNESFPDMVVNVDEFASKTDGLTIDQLKDVLITTQIFGTSIEDAVEKVEGMNVQSGKKLHYVHEQRDKYIGLSNAEIPEFGF